MHGTSIAKGLMTLVLTGLSGCGYMTHDKTQDPAFQVLVGMSFTTVQDAGLVRDACIPNYAAKDCQQLQVTGGFYYARGGPQGWHQLRVPVDQPTMDKAIAAGGKLTWVPKGTQLTVVQVLSRSLGEERRCWLVYARLAGMDPKTVAEIPACFQWAPESSPLWFQPQKIPTKPYEAVLYDYSDKPPLPDPLFLTPVAP